MPNQNDQLFMAMLKKTSIALATVLLYTAPAFCQNQIGFSAGYSVDINNEGRFKQIPLSVQWLPGESAKGFVLFKLDVGIPLKNKSYDSAFTLASGLPPAISVQKVISSSYITASFGYRFLIPLRSANNQFFIDLSGGLTKQEFRVSYPDYDKSKYTILNPDVNLDRTGLVLGLGLGYNIKHFVTQLHIQTPSTAGGSNYKLSYKLNAPLQLSLGYLLLLQKSRK